jgi:hypothetical protein
MSASLIGRSVECNASVRNEKGALDEPPQNLLSGVVPSPSGCTRSARCRRVLGLRSVRLPEHPRSMSSVLTISLTSTRLIASY